MNHGGMQLIGTSMIGAGTSDYKTLAYGMQGVLVIQANPIGVELQLVCKILDNSSFVVVNTSKAIVQGASFVGPLYMPAGSYAIRNVSSSAINVIAGIYPTP